MKEYRNPLTFSSNESKQLGNQSVLKAMLPKSHSPFNSKLKKFRKPSSCESEKETSIGSNDHIPTDISRLEDFHIDLNYTSKPIPKKKVDENKFKTEICKNWAMFGCCKYEFNCKFAHGANELHEKNVPSKEKYKTKGCLTFNSQGFCPYGSRCLFLHNEEFNQEDPRRWGPYKKALESFIEGKKLTTPKDRLESLEKANYLLPAPEYAWNPLYDTTITTPRLFQREIEKLEESMEFEGSEDLKISLDFLD